MARGRRIGSAVALGIALAALIAVLLLALGRHSAPRAILVRHVQPDLSVQWHIGPTLQELRANFAVLRRPATAGEHAAVAMFTAATSAQPEVPEEVRLAGRIDGSSVYLIVYPIFRHGARGAVVAHQMNVAGGARSDVGGFSYVPGHYLIFPDSVGGINTPAAYVGVVPDGVRAVRWQFGCISGSRVRPSGCQLPSPPVVNVLVHDNLAVLQTSYLLSGGGGPYAGVTRVTWYGPAGMSKVFTNPNRAVPFPGAPTWRG